MKKFLKITGIGILLIFTLLILIPVIFKDKIVEIAKTEINNQVNAKVNFGAFDLSIFTYFPNLNFEINDLSVVGLDKFEEDTLAYIKQFSVNVDLMSVMGEQIEVLGIHIIEPQITGHILADNSANWDIAKASEEATPEEEDTPVASTEEEASAPFKLSLKTFSIQKANIKYIDEPGNMSADINNLDYQISGDFSLSQAELEMSLLIEKLSLEMDHVKFLNKVNLEYIANINADLDAMKFEILKNEFRINKLLLALTGNLQMNPDESIDMDLAFNTNENKFKDLLSLAPAVYTKDFADIKTSGELKLGGFAKGKYTEDQLPAFNLNLNIDNASIQYPDLPTAITQIFVDLNIDNKDGIEDHTVIDLKRFDLQLADNPFSARYITKTPISDPYIDGFVKGKIDFDKLKSAIPMDSMSISGLMTMDLAMKGNMSTIEQEKYDEFDAKGNISLENFTFESADIDYPVTISSTNFEVAPKYFTLNNFDAKVGKSDFHADGQIANFIAYYFKDEILKGTFNLSSNLIDGNELAGAEETPETAEAETSTETETTSSESPVEEEPMSVIELPKNIDFALNTNLNQILYDNYDITNFVGNVRLKNGIASLEPVKMNLLGGSIEMLGSYDSRDPKAPKMDFDFNLKGFEIKKTVETFNTIEKLAPIAKNCDGEIASSFKLKATLDERMEPIQESMNGGGTLKSNSITIGGSESLNKLADLIKSDKYKEVTLKNIDASFMIENGNIIISPVDIKWNNSKATFGGKQGVDQSIDYTLNIDFPRSDLGGANQLIDGLMAKGGGLTQGANLGETINLDVFFTGTVTEPKISLGMKDMVTGIKDKVKDLINTGKNEAIAEAKKQATALLAEAQKRSQQLITEAKKQADAIRKGGKKAAEKAKAEADKQIDKLLKDAGGNPIAKMAAKEAGKKLKAEATKKAAKIEQEANKKADQLVSETKKQTSNLTASAKSEGDKLIAKAEKM